MRTSQWVRPIVTVFVLCVAVAAVGMAGARFLSKRSRHIAEQTLPSLSHISMANQFRGQAFQHLVCAVNCKEVEELKREEAEVRSYSEKSRKELDLFMKSNAIAEYQTLFNEFLMERENYLRSRDRILLLCDAGNRSEATAEMVGILLPMYDRYLDKSQDLMDQLHKDGIDEAKSLSSISLWAQLFTVISSIFIFFFGFLLGYTR
ncbi:MAG: MCP four helix bundle domain-containing protein [Verrucomicrobiota bacterium]